MSTTEPENQRTVADETSPEAVTSLADKAGSTSTADVTIRDVRSEIAAAGVFFVFGIALAALGSQLRQGAIPDPVTTGGMPVGIGIMISVISAIVGGRAVRIWRRGYRTVPSEGGNDEPGFSASWTRAMLFAVGCVIWTYMIPRLSYVLMTPIFLAAGLYGFGVRSWPKLTIVPIGFTFVSWYLFGEVLTIRLPWGFLEPWAREIGLIL